jgi:hypothetical protein
MYWDLKMKTLRLSSTGEDTEQKAKGESFHNPYFQSISKASFVGLS